MRPLIPRVLSCQRHGWPSISTWRCRQALAAYPKASDEQSSNAFCLALLPMRLAMRPTVTSGPVVSYTPFHPYPPAETGKAVYSLLRYLSGRPGRTLSAIVLYGARKFLNRQNRSRPSRGLKRTTIARESSKAKRKKTFVFSGSFPANHQSYGYNDDYQAAMQLVGPYIAVNTA